MLKIENNYFRFKKVAKMNTCRTIFYSVFLLFCILILYITFKFGYTKEEFYYPDGFSPLKLEKYLGFTLETPYRKISGQNREVISIENIEPGKFFDQIGFMNGDILIEYRKKNGFYIKLHNRYGNYDFKLSVIKIRKFLILFYYTTTSPQLII